jgi:sugar phosphate isomerase/epimerase
MDNAAVDSGRKAKDVGRLEAHRHLLNGFATQARPGGLRFAYHNHDFEIRPTSGTRGLDVLLSGTDPKLVDFEMDLYWVVFGGGDPVDFFNRYPGRFPMVHVKDSAAHRTTRWSTSAAARFPFATIFAQSDKAGIKHHRRARPAGGPDRYDHQQRQIPARS